MPLSDIHTCRGKRCAYVLRCAGGERWPFTIYCGSTTDVEVRILDHAMGVGAAFCREYPPQELLSLTTHETMEAALCAEVANANLWYGKLRDYRRVKGGRLNMVGDPPHAPRGFLQAERASLGIQENDNGEADPPNDERVGEYG